MKVVYLSNSFNHYQKAFSDEMYKLLGDEYTFIESEQQEQERIALGWNLLEAPYLKKSYEIGEDASKKIINDCDVLIYGLGVAPHSLVKERAKAGKLIFACTERVLKKGDGAKYFLPRKMKYNYYFTNRKNTYLLCMGAYVYSDFCRMGLFENRGFRFGYFPSFVEYDLDKLMSGKKKNSLLWVARMIDWKHPEFALDIAESLRKLNVDFELNLIGNGVLIDSVKEDVKARQLEDCVHVLGPKTPEEVRKYMDESQVYLFTSDRNEGWGVVLNEAMNSGCVPVANKSIGSVPYLLQDNVNGIVYEEPNADELAKKIADVLGNDDKRIELARNGYNTLACEWNPSFVANRLVELCRSLSSGDKNLELFSEGPCSLIK